MSKDKNTPETPAGEASAEQTFIVNAQYTKDLSFENPNAPKSLLDQNEPPEVQINVDVKALKLSEKVYEVTLHINVEGKAKNGDMVVFVCELQYAGVFTLGGFADDQIQPILLIECPRVLFPYARAIISDATREGGYAPLLIHPIDFAGLYLKQQDGA